MRLTKTNKPSRGVRRAILRSLIASALAMAGAQFIVNPATSATTFVVNSAGDQFDLALDGVCDVDGAGTCTLRAAISEANSLAGLDTINFSIPGNPTIVLNAPLTNINEIVVIDGLTQPGSSCQTPQVEIDGSAMPGVANDVLRVNSGAAGTTIRGLALSKFKSNGIGIDVFANAVLIECNRLGIDRSGTIANQVRAGTVLALANGTTASTVGGIGRGNMFGGSAGTPLFLGGTGHLVLGNSFDLDINGAYLPFPLGSTNGTVRAQSILVAGPGNTIGGTANGAGNRLRTGGWTGIHVAPGPFPFNTGNQIRGNSIKHEPGVVQTAASAPFMLPIDLGDLIFFPPTQPTVNFNHQGVVTGPNRYQNYPVITVASVTGGTTRVVGTLDGIPGRSYGIDVFSTPTCHPSGFGGGGTYLGEIVAVAGANGVASFDANLAGGIGEPAGISTTATDLTTLDTSEMSYCRPSTTTNLTWATAQPISGSVSQYVTDRGAGEVV